MGSGGLLTNGLFAFQISLAIVTQIRWRSALKQDARHAMSTACLWISFSFFFLMLKCKQRLYFVFKLQIMTCEESHADKWSTPKAFQCREINQPSSNKTTISNIDNRITVTADGTNELQERRIITPTLGNFLFPNSPVSLQPTPNTLFFLTRKRENALQKKLFLNSLLFSCWKTSVVSVCTESKAGL